MASSIEIDLKKSGASILAAGRALQKIRDSDLYFAQRELRHPVGIYDVSVARIAERGQSLADELFGFFTRFKSPHDPGIDGALNLIEEKLKLFIYALNEHADDCETILSVCFSSDELSARSKPVREFKNSTNKQRKDFLLLANAIKHGHQRLCFFVGEFLLVNDVLVLLGFSLEKLRKGTLQPRPNVLGAGKGVISATVFVWASILNVMSMSRALGETLPKVTTVGPDVVHAWNDSNFRSFAGAAARLPLFTFDEDDPFSPQSVSVLPDPATPLSSVITSFLNPIDHKLLLGPGAHRNQRAGDGSSDITLPKSTGFIRIDRN